MDQARMRLGVRLHSPPETLPTPSDEAHHAAQSLRKPPSESSNLPALQSSAGDHRSIQWIAAKRPGQHLEPVYNFDSERKPRGPKKERYDNDAGNWRGVDGENEGALVLAQHGYDIEQLPEKLSSADYVINGNPEKADAITPAPSKALKGIRDEVERKVWKVKAPYVIVILDSKGQSVEDLSNYMKKFPVQGLKQMFVVQGGKLSIIN